MSEQRSDSGLTEVPLAPRLAGAGALVTGASRGIGYAIAERLIAEGAKVVITARGVEDLEAAAASLGPNAIAVAGKADDPEHREEAIATAISEFGNLRVLINNAGINPAFGPLMKLDAAPARKIFEVNALGTLEWTKSAVHAWMGEHGGSVVNVASIAGMRPAPGIAFYGATKAFIIHLTEELAVELGPNIRVNAVAPAVVKTQFARALYEGREAEASRAYPLKRLGVPADIAAAVAFLASDDSSWITGQTLPLDGGVLLTGGLA